MDHRESPSNGAVVLYSNTTANRPGSHENASRAWVAARLAVLKGYEDAGEYDPAAGYAGHVYFVPAETLVSVETAHELGIRTEDDLFGGVVPYPFVATKAITHPLVDAQARAPEGWSHDFGRRVADSILLGHAAFSPDDARRAGERMLKSGPARVKESRGIGGRGQIIVMNAGELEAALNEMHAEELARYGIVIEQQLEEISTYSVGQVRVAGLMASYCGSQRLTQGNDGHTVYGGSDLLVVHGDFDALLDLDLAPEIRLAVDQARKYDVAAAEEFPGLLASRRNYDVARGRDPGGQWRSGVLEQSWRIGGASPAEVTALEAFRADPDLRTVRAATVEVHGECEPPRDAIVYFSGEDERVGPITKYALIAPYGNTH
jgi:Protein of unknown function (DUF3182)